MKTEKPIKVTVPPNEEFNAAKSRFIDKLTEFGRSEIAVRAESATTMAELNNLSNSTDVNQTLRTELQMSLGTYGPDRTYLDSMNS